jgi:hypothetical protein
MRRRQLRCLWARLARLQGMQLTCDELLTKLGAAKSKVPAAWQAWRLVDVEVASVSKRTCSSAFWPTACPSRSAGSPGRQPKPRAPGLTARSALEKFAAVQMVDVQMPTTGGRELTLTVTRSPSRNYSFCSSACG